MSISSMRAKRLLHICGALFLLFVSFFVCGVNPSSAWADSISVRTYNANGNTFESASGIHQDALVTWLESHEHDSYYLGTPYPDAFAFNAGGDCRNPNGDPSHAYGIKDRAGWARMNCTGFVWHALWSAGWYTNPGYWTYSRAYNQIPCWGGVGAGGWSTYLTRNNVKYITVRSSSATWSGSSMLTKLMQLWDNGTIEKGDIIWTWDTGNSRIMSNGLAGPGGLWHHVGIAWGRGTWWQSGFGYVKYLDGSSSNSLDRNIISYIAPLTNSCNTITIVKMGASNGGVWFKKTDNPELYSGTGKHELNGATYGVYRDFKEAAANSWGNVTTMTTQSYNGEAGHAWTSMSLSPGTYYIREWYTAPGYQLDPTIYKVTVPRRDYNQLASVTKVPSSGWVAAGGSWYLLKDGKMAKGWAKAPDDQWYYFNSSGTMLTGWQWIGGAWYYLRTSGTAGSMVTGWQWIGGTWYYFDDNGVMQTGWTKTKENRWYYFYSWGGITSGWQWIGNHWYYLDYTYGALQNEWLAYGGSWYYFTNTCAMATTWAKTPDGTWYAFYPSGVMRTGWYSYGGSWYYLKSSGAMATNMWAGNYWLGSDGVMAKNAWVDKDRYYVGSDGAWVPGKVKPAPKPQPAETTKSEPKTSTNTSSTSSNTQSSSGAKDTTNTQSNASASEKTSSAAPDKANTASTASTGASVS